jgi:hypothetical protein
MSKVDALRAMREARYEEDKKRAAAAAPRSRPPVAPAAPAAKRTAVKKAPAAKVPAAAEAGSDTEALCGHRNMGGRTCTREHGHTAKSHRYS